MTLSLSEYMTAVKVERKKLDGRETYSKWTDYIHRAFNAGMSADLCAHNISVIDFAAKLKWWE